MRELSGSALLDALEKGDVRAAEPLAEGAGWRVNAWVKQALLELFRSSPTVEVGDSRELWPFVDAPPSTPMGEAIESWRLQRASQAIA